MLRVAQPLTERDQALFVRAMNFTIETNEDSSENEDEHIWSLNYLYARELFSWQLANKVLKDMILKIQEPDEYYLNDYHYLLLYDVLDNYVVIHNDYLGKKRVKIGRFFFGVIDFDLLIDKYLFDVDFTMPAVIINCLNDNEKKSLGLNREIFAIANGMIPHYEELVLKKCER